MTIEAAQSSTHAIDDARWTCLLDIRSPFSYLGLHPTESLARDLGITINWLPIVVPPLHEPSSPGADDDRSILHRRARAQALAREIEIYGAAQGLELCDYYRDADAKALNLGWLFARRHLENQLFPFLEASFRAYWADELDPSDTVSVASRIDALGGDPASFETWSLAEGGAENEKLASELRDRGLSSAPCHLVGGEVLVGRQHLPMIRWILEGRNGPGPI